MLYQVEEKCLWNTWKSIAQLSLKHNFTLQGMTAMKKTKQGNQIFTSAIMIDSCCTYNCNHEIVN